MFYIGLMSGTSADGIDAVLVTIPSGQEAGGEGRETKNEKLALIAAHTQPYPAELRQKIRALARPVPGELDLAGELDNRLGELFAQAALALLAKTGVRPAQVRAIGSHGQTLRHRPGGSHPFTLQVGNPAIIAERTGITTVADFRRRDMAAGGQGAPLAPAFHRYQFHADGRHRAILNIGGLANVTYLPPDPPHTLGFDTGPGNALLDEWALRHLGQPYDEDGRWAAAGRPVAALLAALRQDPYFARTPPKSTGREHFHLGWLEAHLDALALAPAPVDVQATLLRLTAGTIAEAIRTFLPRTDEVFVCGGGAHNRALMAALQEELAGVPVQTTEALGLHPDWVEAAAFAWLAHQAVEGRPGNVPRATGACREVVLGGIYPGSRE